MDNPLRTDIREGPSAAHLRDYWRILLRGRYTVLTIFVVVVGLTLLRVTFSTPIYRATTVIEVKPEARRILPGQEQWVGAEGGGWIAEEKYFNTQLQVLKSRDVAERVFRRLHLEKHPLFAELKDPVEAFANRIEVRPRIETRLVAVSLTGTNPTEVTEWVNVLADVYVKRNVDEAMESFNAIMDEISRGLDRFRTSMGEADTTRFRLAAEEELYVPENQQEILKERLETYNEQLSANRVDVGRLQAELDSLNRVRLEGGDLLALPLFAQDPVVTDLNSQRLEVERDLERLASQKKPRHPEYLARKKDFEKIEQSLTKEAVRVAETLQVSLDLKKSEAVFLQEQIRRTEEDAYRVEQAFSTYDMLKNDAEAKKKVYDVVAETMERLSVGAQLVSMNNNVAVLDQAIEPRRPVRPRKLVSLAFGSVMGLLLGLGAVLFMDYLDNTVRTPEDVEQYLGLSMLAIVPKRRESNSQALREAFQSLRTSVLFSSHNRERRILLVTSAGPREGKSTTTMSLARAFASSGDRVIIVDCDLRRPTQHSLLGVSREPGLTNYLLEGKESHLENYIRPTDSPTLHLIPCGAIPPNPPDLIGMAKFREFLLGLKETYDWVLVDSPPLMNLADTVVLASLSEMVALVIKHNENDRDLIRRGVKQLRGIKANLIGAVLNSVDVGRSHYGDYYYAGYYYYGEDGRREGRSRSRRSHGSDEKRPSDRVAL